MCASACACACACACVFVQCARVCVCVCSVCSCSQNDIPCGQRLSTIVAIFSSKTLNDVALNTSVVELVAIFFNCSSITYLPIPKENMRTPFAFSGAEAWSKGVYDPEVD